MIFKPRLFVLQAAVIAFIATVHINALLWSLYWKYIWLDIPVHFLGGLWAALASMWVIAYALKRVPPLLVLLSVLAISIGWEVFEFLVGVPREGNYMFDSSLDLLMDTLGGVCGYLIANRMLQSNFNGKDETDPS